MSPDLLEGEFLGEDPLFLLAAALAAAFALGEGFPATDLSVALSLGDFVLLTLLGEGQGELYASGSLLYASRPVRSIWFL